MGCPYRTRCLAVAYRHELSEPPAMLRLLTILTAVAASHADIRSILHAQGYGGWLNGRETIVYAGQIREGRNSYQIFVYRGLFRAAVVDHGVNELFVVKNGTKVLGRYHIPMPTSCRVKLQSVICKTESPGVIRFTKRGPPKTIWFDGEICPFEGP